MQQTEVKQPEPPTPMEADEAAQILRDRPHDRTDEDEERLDGIMDHWRSAAENAEMEVYRPTQFPKLSEWHQLTEMAEGLALAASLPEPLRRKPADVALLLLVARDVGIPPTTALNRIHVIKGRPTMAAELMRALILERGHKCWFEDVSSFSATFCAQRKGEDRVDRVTWTLDDAKQAELIVSHDGKRVTKGTNGKDPWVKFTRSMLKARATSELVRDQFPDVVLGVSYTPEEMGADVGENGEPVKVESGQAAAPLMGAVSRDAFAARLAALSDELRAEIVVEWKERLIPPLGQASTHYIAAIDALITERELKMPDEVEIVEEPAQAVEAAPTGAMVAHDRTSGTKQVDAPLLNGDALCDDCGESPESHKQGCPQEPFG